MSVNRELAERLVEFLNDMITYDQELASAMLWGEMPDNLTSEQIERAGNLLRQSPCLLVLLDELTKGRCIEAVIQEDGQVLRFTIPGSEEPAPELTKTPE